MSGQYIRVAHGLSALQIGSCNACTDREPFVTNVELRGMSFRLCGKCRRNLLNQLAGPAARPEPEVPNDDAR